MFDEPERKKVGLEREFFNALLCFYSYVVIGFVWAMGTLLLNGSELERLIAIPGFMLGILFIPVLYQANIAKWVQNNVRYVHRSRDEDRGIFGLFAKGLVVCSVMGLLFTGIGYFLYLIAAKSGDFDTLYRFLFGNNLTDGSMIYVAFFSYVLFLLMAYHSRTDKKMCKKSLFRRQYVRYYRDIVERDCPA